MSVSKATRQLRMWFQLDLFEAKSEKQPALSEAKSEWDAGHLGVDESTGGESPHRATPPPPAPIRQRSRVAARAAHAPTSRTAAPRSQTTSPATPPAPLRARARVCARRAH